MYGQLIGPHEAERSLRCQAPSSGAFELPAARTCVVQRRDAIDTTLNCHADSPLRRRSTATRWLSGVVVKDRRRGSGTIPARLIVRPGRQPAQTVKSGAYEPPGAVKAVGCTGIACGQRVTADQSMAAGMRGRSQSTIEVVH